MPALSKADIRKINDIKVEQVDVPEWGGYVKVRAMTGFERDQFDMLMTSTGDDGKVKFQIHNLRLHMVVACCVDDDGNQLFDESDRAWLMEKSAGALERVASVAMRLSGMMPDSKGKAVANFTPALNGALSSA